jgi:hypothetical protein
MQGGFFIGGMDMCAKDLSKKETLMSRSIIHIKLILVLSGLMCISLLSGACSNLQATVDPDQTGDQYTSQEQALGAEGDVSSAALACPSDLTEFVLFATHTWDFSPGRELDLMKVEGQTGASSPCPFSVAGNTVIMEECTVPISNTGFIQTDAGPCDITASGAALISIEDASCEDGVITMTIVESINPDTGSGAMNCPETSQPYFPLFPFSRTTRTFHIQVGGVEASESVDPDMSGQFMYNKTWSVHSETMGSPLPEGSGD